jgi:hypothetical protein
MSSQATADYFQHHCKYCHQSTDDPQHPSVVCGGCNCSLHCSCEPRGRLPTIPRKPFYCLDCLARYDRENVRDCTLDAQLMDYLYDGVQPEAAEVRERV